MPRPSPRKRPPWCAAAEPQAGGVRQAGFTLIELLAVVVILGLLATLVVPSLGRLSGRAVRNEADALADAVEFARQRAIMTGRQHQITIDLDDGFYQVEWLVPDPVPTRTPAPAQGNEQGVTAESEPVDLEAPPEVNQDFEPVPGPFGRGHQLADDVWVLEVSLPEVKKEKGAINLTIEPDGTTDPARIRLGDPDGREAWVIEIEPLADAVRVLPDDGAG
jgi:prepilin-type N-terminal cleavage/methylation domain-containing protein